MARPIKKLSREVRVQVEQRIHAGDVSYTWIAASFNISKERVSQIAKEVAGRSSVGCCAISRPPG
jgi:hypothetical protein